MATESVAVNGTNLMNAAVRLEDLSGLYASPARRSKNITVPGRHGEVVIPVKLYTSGTIVLKMSVLGVDKVTGQVPSGSSDALEFQHRVDELMALFTSGTLQVDHTLPDGSVRRAIAELDTSPVVFQPQVSLPRYGTFSVALTVPTAFWTDTSAVSTTITGATGTVGSLSAFAGATAPMTGLTVTFGPCSNPQIAQGNTYLSYGGVIAAGQQLVVDCSSWSLSTGTGTAWSPSYSNVTYSPGPAWWSLDPTATMSATFTHTEGASASVTISGYRRFMTG